MFRWTRIVALATLITFMNGCAAAQAWWQDLKTNPVSELQQDVQYISNAISLAEVAFSLFSTISPTAASQVAPTFHALIARVRQALAVAMDGLRVAADAQGNPPDPDALLRDTRAALGDLQTFLTSLSNPGHAISPEMQAALHAIQEAQRTHHAR
jgi:hypothetical protein